MYLVGDYKGNVDFDTGPGEAYYNSLGRVLDYVQKRDADGNFEWFVDFKSIGTVNNPKIDAFTVDDQGNVYLAGNFGYQFDADPSAGEHLLGENPQPGGQLFIIKYDTNGNLIWGHYLKGTIKASGIAVDSNNNVNIAGHFANTIDFDPSASDNSITENSSSDISGYNLALTSQGEFIKVDQLVSDNYSLFYDVEVDSLDNKYLLGVIVGTVDADFGSTTVNISSNTNNGAYIILKYDSNDNFIWERRIDNENGGAAFENLHLDNQNNILLSGNYFGGSIDVDPGNGVYNVTNSTLTAYSGSLVVKWNTNGLFQWARSFVGDATVRLYGIDTDSNNNLYTVGFFTKHAGVDFDDSSAIDIHSTGANRGDMYLNKIAANGIYEWTYTMDTTEATIIRGVALSANNEIICGGSFIGTVDFDPSTTNVSVTSSGIIKNYSDSVILKFSQPALSIESSEFPDKLGLYPNPMGNSSVINLQKQYTTISIQITNVLGEVIQKEKTKNSSTVSIENIKTPGLYFVQLEADGKKAILKLIKK
jgi:hypothetical protein